MQVRGGELITKRVMETSMPWRWAIAKPGKELGTTHLGNNDQLSTICVGGWVGVCMRICVCWFVCVCVYASVVVSMFVCVCTYVYKNKSQAKAS